MLLANVLKNRCVGLSPSERDVLEAAVSQTRTFEARQIVVHQNVPVNVSTLLLEGFMTRYVDSPDGRRHLVAVHVPGDFVDLHAHVLKRLDHDVGTLTAARVAIFPHAALDRIVATDGRLAQRLWFMTLMDAAMHRHWIFRLASLNATERIAHFLCEMNARLLAIGASDGTAFTLPMTQSDLGEVCGLTNVHVSRVLRELREAGLCRLRSSRVHLGDPRALVARAGFDPGYLYLDARTAALASGAA